MKRGRVEVTAGFFLLLAWLNYLDGQSVVPLALAACTLHELGHLAALRCLGGDVKAIRLTAVGAEMVMDRSLSYAREGLAALAGPAVNLAAAFLSAGMAGWELFAGLNLVLGCFNLLPVGRLDGGRVLFCFLAFLAGPDPARRLGGLLDLTLTAVLLSAGLWLAGAGGNVTLLLVALWLAANLLGNRELVRNMGHSRGQG